MACVLDGWSGRGRVNGRKRLWCVMDVWSRGNVWDESKSQKGMHRKKKRYDREAESSSYWLRNTLNTLSSDSAIK